MATYNDLQLTIHRIEARIEEHATELRVALEELAEQVRKLEEEPYEHPDDAETYYTVNGTEQTSYDIEDLAASVGEIETMFDENAG